MADLYCTGCAHKLADHVKVKRVEGRASRVTYRCIGAVATSGHCACTGYSGPVVDQWKERALKAESTLREIHLLALEANEEYESSCRAKVNRIYMLSKVED